MNCGNCGSCGGCGASLELTEAEIEMLETLGQYAFLPICRRADDMTPMYFEEDRYSLADYSIILQLLQTKRLISLDYDQPMGPSRPDYPVRGSMALTQRGQLVLEQLQLQGAQ